MSDGASDAGSLAASDTRSFDPSFQPSPGTSFLVSFGLSSLTSFALSFPVSSHRCIVLRPRDNWRREMVSPDREAEHVSGFFGRDFPARPTGRWWSGAAVDRYRTVDRFGQDLVSLELHQHRVVLDLPARGREPGGMVPSGSVVGSEACWELRSQWPSDPSGWSCPWYSATSFLLVSGTWVQATLKKS